MPDEGRGAIAERHAGIQDAPADVDVVAGRSELRVEAAHRHQRRLAEDHVAAGQMLGAIVGDQHVPQLGIAMLISVWFTSTRLKIKGAGIWRVIFYLPNLMMAAVVAALFFSLFSYYGPVNQILVRAGIIPDAIDYIRDRTVMRALVVFIQWWLWFGQTIIILMAAMTSISVSVYEAALVDGANGWQMFRFITLPLIKPVMIYILVTSLVGGMQMFDIPYLLTDGRGSPANAILTNNILMYMKFRSSQGHIGAASSVGMMVFVMTSFVALLIFYLLRDKDAIKTKKKKNGGSKCIIIDFNDQSYACFHIPVPGLVSCYHGNSCLDAGGECHPFNH